MFPRAIFKIVHFLYGPTSRFLCSQAQWFKSQFNELRTIGRGPKTKDDHITIFHSGSYLPLIDDPWKFSRQGRRLRCLKSHFNNKVNFLKGILSHKLEMTSTTSLFFHSGSCLLYVIVDYSENYKTYSIIKRYNKQNRWYTLITVFLISSFSVPFYFLF